MENSIITIIVTVAVAFLAFKFLKSLNPSKLFRKRSHKARPSWDFCYEKDFPDTAGPNMAGIITDGHGWLFYHAYANEENEDVICHIHSSLNMTEDTEECSFLWTPKNESILLDALNNLENPNDYCGEGSPIRMLKFMETEND